MQSKVAIIYFNLMQPDPHVPQLEGPVLADDTASSVCGRGNVSGSDCGHGRLIATHDHEVAKL